MRRRVSKGLFVPAGAVALLAVLAAHALAQPVASPLPGGLRTGIEDSDDARDAARRPGPPRSRSRADELPRFGSLPGAGASRTGFVSNNLRRRSGSRSAVRRPGGTTAQPASTTSAPLSIVPSGLPVSATSSTSASANPTAKSSIAATPMGALPAATIPSRPTLLRIPDGTAGGTVANTVSSSRLTTASTTLLRRRTAVEEDAFGPLGAHVGTFLVLPSLDVVGGYDTNPARVPNARSSFFTTVSPEIIAKSDWIRHEVTATLRGSYTAYDKTPELDRPAFDGKLTGRLDVTRNTALIGEGTMVIGTDNPGSPNVQAGLTRFPIYTTLGTSFGVRQTFNRIEVTAKGTVERTEYQESKFTDGATQDNSDRDFNRYGGAVRTTYDLMPGLKPFVEGAADTREHDIAVDRFGFQRDSNGWYVKGGSTFEFSRKLTGEAAIGWLERSYKDPSLQKLSGFTVDGALLYELSALTRFKLTAQTVAAETTVPGTAGTLTRNAGLEVEHSFRRWLIGSVKFNYGFDDYVGSERKDDRFSIAGAITYKLNRWAQAKAEVRQEWLRSTALGVDYNATVFMLGMKLTP